MKKKNGKSNKEKRCSKVVKNCQKFAAFVYQVLKKNEEIDS